MAQPVGFRIDAEVKGIDKAIRGLSLVGPKIRKGVESRIRMRSMSFARAAKTKINAELSHHKSGAGIKLGTRKRASVLSVGYQVRKMSGMPMAYRINDLGGASGRVAAIAEFAKTGRSEQGKALIASMDKHFGARSGGRVLYREVDEGAPELIRDIQEQVNIVCAEIDRAMGA